MRRIPIVSLLLLLLSPAISISQSESEASPRPFQLISTGPGLSLHKDMYMLPITWSSEYQGSQSEAVFRISAKHRLFKSRFYFAYTQISFWQAYDAENSAPFRETNYNPEFFYRFATSDFRGGFLGADAGFEHESNGQVVGPSRSWNLLYLSPYYYQANFLIYLKLRYRIPEAAKEQPDLPEGDDNPDITDYLGYSDLDMFLLFLRNHYLHLTLRGNIATGKGGVSLTYNYPLPYSNNSYIVLKISHGYGESLVDYKRSLDRVGLGIMFTR